MRAEFASLLIALIGVALFFAPSFVRLAQVTYDATPPTLLYPQPSGTRDSPTPLSSYIGEEYRVKCVAGDSESGIANVTVVIESISGDEYSATLTLLRGDRAVGNYYEYYYDWIVPDIVATLQFNFTAYDKAGNAKSEATYAITSEMPDGYFTLETPEDPEVEVSEETHAYVRSPELTIRFYATKSGELIQAVRVIVKRGDTTLKDFNLEEVETDKVWEGEYTLPEEGTYTLEGYFEYADQWYKKMEIAVPWGVAAPVSLSLLLRVAGALLAVAGVASFAACRWLGRCLLPR